MAGSIITQDELKELLHYDPDTGIFTRIKALTNCVKVGDVAGTKNKHGYIMIRVDGKKYSAHRLSWLYMTGSFPIKTIDHVNRIRHDNRFSNLRIASYFENSLNTGIGKTNTSGYKGVNWNKNLKKWMARCAFNGERVFLGYYNNIDTAKIAYDNFAKIHHGEFYLDSSHPTV